MAAVLAVVVVAAVDVAPGAAAPAVQVVVADVDGSLRLTDTDLVTVTARDAGGEIDTSYAGTVTFTTSNNFGNGLHVLPRDDEGQVVQYTFTPSDQGSVDFLTAWNIDGGPGDHVLTVSGTLPGGGSSESSFPVTVGESPIRGVELTDFEVPATVGVEDEVTVTALNAAGETEPSYTGTVTWDSDCTGPVQNCVVATPQTYTFTPADAGVATFTLRWTQPECGFAGFTDLGLGDNNADRSLYQTCAEGQASPGVIPTPHCDNAPPSGFVDIAGNVHEHNIDCIAAAHITTGGPGGRPANEYGPELPNTRGQIMTFIVRMLSVSGYQDTLPFPTQDWYDDDNGTAHEFNTNALAEMGVTDTSTRTFRHADGVHRDEMAEFLGRAYAEATGTTPPTGPDRFPDDDGNLAEPWINTLANAGVVQGDGNGNYVPANVVNRDQMASFIARTTAWLLAAR